MTEAGDGDMGERLTATHQDRQEPDYKGRAKTGPSVQLGSDVPYSGRGKIAKRPAIFVRKLVLLVSSLAAEGLHRVGYS